jgi:hypothetical protein
MSKLKELREELGSSMGATPEERDEVKPKVKVREGSQESNGSLETKVNQFYEGSPGKSVSSSREITPVDEESAPDPLRAPKSPSIPVNVNLNINESGSPSLTSPARTPVTQNDPLGALADEDCADGVVLSATSLKVTPLQTIVGEGDAILNRDSPKRTCSEGNIGIGSTTSLTRTVGQGHHNGGVDLSGTGAQSSKAFHRSSTLPNYASNLAGVGLTGSGGSTPTGSENLGSCVGSVSGSNVNVVSSLSAFGSSLKSFRYLFSILQI